jgi:hypothetical protein
MQDRDLTKSYSRSQFVAKLRRLADAIESERPFTIQAYVSFKPKRLRGSVAPAGFPGSSA